MTLKNGDTIGRYLILNSLGTGAMGEVYRAKDDQIGRDVAIKILSQSLESRLDLHSRFRREANAVASISHKNVVQIYDTGEYNGLPFFVMEYLDGTDCEKLLLKHGRLEPALVYKIGAAIAKALAAVAKANVIHRDIKPANIFITSDGQFKLMDFGLVKAPAYELANTGKLTLKGTTLGTPDYISPEQAKGEELDGKSDVYSLGATLFHLLIGYPPFRRPGEKINHMEVVARHVKEPAPLLSALCGDLPPNLELIIDRMLAKDPKQRPELFEIEETFSLLNEFFNSDDEISEIEISNDPEEIEVKEQILKEKNRIFSTRYISIIVMLISLISAIIFFISK